MAKGTKKKTKWVSLSLANANTKTSCSNATGSDSEQTSHQPHGDVFRNKMVIAMTAKLSKEMEAKTYNPPQYDERTLDQSGHRTDTSTGSEGHAGTTDRRPGTAGTYHRRRPPSYRSGWSNGNGGTTTPNARSHYNRTGSYGNGGSGYYGAGRKSHYDSHYTRRPVTVAPSTTRTTSGEGGGGDGGATTINDDEYTRITTPRQDVLFKKGYLSRPKPSVATASTSNTTSSSLAGTTSEGSDGGNGGSNSISTTESITSEYGGSYAADGSPLFDYSFPCIPCGYFTENGVLVMNGFAVDNNGFSYFNGGQTYIYPPNFANCQQSPTPSTATGAEDQPTDTTLPYPVGNDETNANESNDFEASSTNHTTPVLLESVVAPVESGLAFSEPLATVEEETAHPYSPGGNVSAMERAPVSGLDEAGPAQDVAGATVPSLTQEVQDFSENGYFQYTNGYDFAQFYSSLCYPSWLMEQYRMYDDAGLPLYCGGEYAMSGEEVYGQQSSFKKRKKRFRTFEEMPSGNGASNDVVDATSSLLEQSISSGGDATSCVPENPVPKDDVAHHSYQLNAEVQEFQPSSGMANQLPEATTAGAECTTTDNVTDGSATKGNNQTAHKSRPSAGSSKCPKSSSSKVTPSVPAAASNATTEPSLSVVSPTAKPPSSKVNRKKDLIQSTLAFAAQNIDLTRPKVSSSVEPHDSELFWTTIDRNGRKKRVPAVPAEQEPTVVGESVQESSPDIAKSAVSSEPKETLLPVSQSAQPASVSTEVSNGKKEQQGKSKKKTQKHKRQQLRKTVGSYNKQPLEGFQLIEPEFPSAASGHRRGKSCDKTGRAEVATATPPAPVLGEVKQESELQLSSSSPILEQQESSDGRSCGEEETHQEVATVELNCDSQCNGRDAMVEEIGEVVVAEEEVIAQRIVVSSSQSLSPAVDVNTIVNETETEKHREEAQGPNVEEITKKEAPGNEVDQVAVVLKQTDPDRTESVAVSTEEEVDTKQTSTEEGLCYDEIATESDELIPSDASQSPANEEQQVPNTQLSVETDVLTSAAKQLTISSICHGSPSLREEDAEEQLVDAADDGIGSEGDDTTRTTKRSSVAGVGYTESIDSGLQSPAPCGGVASPEAAAASMVSSIESQPAIDSNEEAAKQSQILTQAVGSWLMQKLEVHEPDEVFTLPSDPLLIQRLERFHQLQRRRIRRDRLRGSVTSDSEDEEDAEYELDDVDTDSDYMSDGQGARVDRTQRTENDDGVATKTQPRLDESKREHEVAHRVSGSINSERSVPREAADSKRCTIM
uniref:Uncharacterized protein n=1 Tax=Anopheles farauti TaxID=69004 RepID=A0A182QKY3_9DIPT